MRNRCLVAISGELFSQFLGRHDFAINLNLSSPLSLRDLMGNGLPDIFIFVFAEPPLLKSPFILCFPEVLWINIEENISGTDLRSVKAI